MTSGQTAPCWVVTARGYAYITNTMSDNISAYELGADGALSLLWSATTGTGPIDAATSNDDRFLYVLNAGDDSLGIYGIDPDSGLLTEQPAFTGLPDGAAGLVAR